MPRKESLAHSVSPSGEKFPIPRPEEYAAEMKRLQKLVDEARAEGKEVVVVMGVGFVGAVMAAIVADTVDKETGQPNKFVIGCQRPSPRSYWKIPLLNRGESPVSFRAIYRYRRTIWARERSYGVTRETEERMIPEYFNNRFEITVAKPGYAIVTHRLELEGEKEKEIVAPLEPVPTR